MAGRPPSELIYDVAIIGGGINGCGIARDAAGRGLTVFLCDKGDLGGATSANSTKLIHGGLRYLEQYEFRLVRKALQERETLLNIAPHLVTPLTFAIPYQHHLRPRWMIRLGLFCYDHLARRHKLAGSHGVDLRTHPAGTPLQDEFTHGFTYTDCWADDHRLVIANALDAAHLGASINPFTGCTHAVVEDGLWHLTLDEGYQIKARTLVNATGPWAKQFLEAAVPAVTPKPLRLVKGSHIVVPKLFDHDMAYLFQHGDGRVIFAIPYEQDFTLIGTTEEDFTGDPAAAACSAGETAYLCAVANHYFNHTITPEDVVWHYSGVRPLLDEQHASAHAASRDYTLEYTAAPGAPLLNVWGGKLTTYRRLAEDALALLGDKITIRQNWTATRPLPGGELPAGDLQAYAATLLAQYPWLPAPMAHRFARTYGTRSQLILGTATCLEDLGQHFGATLYAAEVKYLSSHEWAASTGAVLWRRTKLGLHLPPTALPALAEYIEGAQ